MASKRKELDSILNPVGSLEYMDVEGFFDKGSWQKNDDVPDGTYNIVHGGLFSKENYAANSISHMTNRQDRDAAYEAAFKWEQDRQDLLEQRRFNDAVLAEQREYDSDIQRVKRARAAGINLDLNSGSSGSSSSGGSSAQMAQTEIKDQDLQTKFSNRYDNLHTAFEGINTAANFIGSLSGGVGSIMSAFTSLATLPSQTALNTANAGLANAQSNEINTLLDGKKKSIDLQNVSEYMGQVGYFQDMLKPGFTDDEAVNLFSTLGIGEDQHSGLMRSIRGVHENPDILAKFNADKLNARKSQMEERIYNDQVVERMVNLQKDIDFSNLQFEHSRSRMLASVESALAGDDQYVGNLIDTEKNNVAAQNSYSSIARQNAAYDIKVWSDQMDERKKMVNESKAKLDLLKEQGLKNGWTHEETLNYNSAWIEYTTMKTALAEEFDKAKTSYYEFSQKFYEREALMTENGGLRNLDNVGAEMHFSGVTCDNWLQSYSSMGEIVRGWVGTAGQTGRDLMIGIAALRSPAAFNETRSREETVRSLYNSKTGQWIPQERTRVSYGKTKK